MTGDTWRWGLNHAPTQPTIQVIEPGEKREQPEHVQRVPFGFGRALHEAAPPPPFWHPV